mmetsp:Transcript_282/g.294  ORF Transcript_282/g.294 Transcript_282/m.294 type:complete len:346 (+) Transcript_282:398-1435(+)
MIIRANGTSYECNKVVGNGSFGVVYMATELGKDKTNYTGDIVAIKRVLQDRRYKNRELQIMRMLSHTNVVQLINSFYEHEGNDVYLNLVLEYVPQTLYKYNRQHHRAGKRIPMVCIQLYTYQLMRSLGYVHSLGICHRDIKPQNLLINPATHELKLCDFGSAKMLVKGEPSVSYICSRYYRAPELIFRATNYTQSIDVWSTGCVLGEMVLGSPIFPGESGVDQLVEIMRVLGTPTKEQLQAMNPNHQKFQFPEITPHPWYKLFPAALTKQEPHFLDFVDTLLRYTPTERCSALEACAHPFFDTLRNPRTKLPEGGNLPPLFDFSKQEIEEARKINALDKLLVPNC